MIDVTQPYSPGWWANRLLVRLLAKQDRLNRLDRYLNGFPDLPATGVQCSHQFQQFQQKARMNLAALVVDAVADRLEPVGIRTGASGDGDTDELAWAIWQANQMDATAKLFHRSTVLSLGEGYTIVGGVDADIGVPLISVEDPREVITEQDAARRWRTLAALKVYYDSGAGGDVLILYLPGQVWRAFRERRVSDAVPGVMPEGWQSWSWTSADRVPMGRVPVVKFSNRPDVRGRTIGEFEDVIAHIDRINHMLLQRLVIATLQAFKQRAIKGIPSHDQAGAEIDYDGMFTMDPGALWLLPAGAEMWESGQVDLSGILNSVKDDVRDFAAVTRTPLYMFSPDAANGSAEGASLSREGLVFKSKDRSIALSESWELTISLAFEVLGDPVRSRRVDMEMLWAPFERLSMAERYDAAAKAAAAGVPWRFTMSDVLQMSPQQIERMERDRVAAALTMPTGGVTIPAGRVTMTSAV